MPFMSRLNRFVERPKTAGFTPLVRSVPLRMGSDFRRVDPFQVLGPMAAMFQSALIDMSNARAGTSLGASAEMATMAVQAIRDAFARDFPDEEATDEKVGVVASIGLHEGGWGTGWKDHLTSQGHMTHMEGSSNWGAVQCKCKPEDGVCCDGCGLWEDSRPTAAGQQKYEWCFERYDSPVDAAARILHLFLDHMPLVTAVWATGDLDKVAWAMRESRYFEGFTTDHREAAISYSGALMKCAETVASLTGEPLVLFQGGMDEAIAAYNGENPDSDSAQSASSGLATAAKVLFGMVALAGAAFGGKVLIDRHLAKRAA